MDDEVESRSACERRIEVEDRQICQDVRSSNGTYGAAPFKTHIECDARPQDHCTIEVIRRVTGDVISRYDVCERDLKFRKDGEYQVQCIVNGRRDANRCSTNISVDSPTKPKT